jgi:hypothetical protein
VLVVGAVKRADAGGLQVPVQFVPYHHINSSCHRTTQPVLTLIILCTTSNAKHPQGSISAKTAYLAPHLDGPAVRTCVTRQLCCATVSRPAPPPTHTQTHLDVPLAEAHLDCLLHDGQQARVVHSDAPTHQVTQAQDLGGLGGAAGQAGR